MKRAATGNQDTLGTYHFERPQVEFFVPSQSSLKSPLGSGKSGRIEYDGVILAPGGRIILQQIESVGFHPFHFISELFGIQLFVFFGYFQNVSGYIDGSYM